MGKRRAKVCAYCGRYGVAGFELATVRRLSALGRTENRLVDVCVARAACEARQELWRRSVNAMRRSS